MHGERALDSNAPVALLNSRPFEAVPKHVSIELTSHCNRDCWFCPRWGDRSGKRKDAEGNPVIAFMPTEHVLSLMRQVWEMGYRGNMNFHHLSEPFIDKRLIPLARKAKEIGFRVIVHTNGDTLRASKEMAAGAVDVFDEITVGLYDYGSQDERLHEEEFWVEHLAGARHLHFTRHEIVFPRHCVDERGPRMADARRAVEMARPHPCEMVREHLIVHYDGNIALCCEDYPDQFNLGNAFDVPLREIWWGARRKDVIDRLSRPGGRLNFPLCAECPFPPAQHLYEIAKAGTEVRPHEAVFAV